MVVEITLVVWHLNQYEWTHAAYLTRSGNNYFRIGFYLIALKKTNHKVDFKIYLNFKEFIDIGQLFVLNIWIIYVRFEHKFTYIFFVYWFHNWELFFVNSIFLYGFIFVSLFVEKSAKIWCNIGLRNYWTIWNSWCHCLHDEHQGNKENDEFLKLFIVFLIDFFFV